MISLLVFGTIADDYRCPTKIGKLLYYVAVVLPANFIKNARSSFTDHDSAINIGYTR